MPERIDLLRRLIADIDAKLLETIDAAGALDEVLINRIANLEAARGSLWRVLSEEEASRP